MLGLIDSKICNIFSFKNMLKKLEADFILIEKPEDFNNVSKIILPGVGAFPEIMEYLKKYNLIDKIKDFANNGNYILGICLGMQILFEESEEFGSTKGLGLIPGKIIKIRTKKVLPHMGWNDLNITQNIDLLKNVHNKADVYFVHTYRAETENKFIAAYTDYDEKIPAVVYNKNIFGTQFHPEKSKKWGELILNNFINL